MISKKGKRLGKEIFLSYLPINSLAFTGAKSHVYLPRPRQTSPRLWDQKYSKRVANLSRLERKRQIRKNLQALRRSDLRFSCREYLAKGTEHSCYLRLSIRPESGKSSLVPAGLIFDMILQKKEVESQLENATVAFQFRIIPNRF